MQVQPSLRKFLPQDKKHCSRRLILFTIALLALLSSVTAVAFSASSAHAASCSGTAYTVQAGDTLSGIAYRYHANWQHLATQNSIHNPDLIFVGQSICITSGSAPVKTGSAPQQQAAAKPQAPVAQSQNQSVDAIIDEVFGPYAASAKSVAMCESTMNPNAYNGISIGGSHAAGVFQILYPSTWNTTSQAGQSPYNARANIVAAHEIFVRDGYSWREWVCR